MKTIVAIGIALLMLASAGVLTVNVTASGPTQPVVMTYDYHDPVHIDSNAGFNATNGFNAGNGTIWAPWVFEHQTIINESGYMAMYIGNTTDFFIVQESDFDGAATGGIYLRNVGNATIQFNNVTNCTYGIFADWNSTLLSIHHNNLSYDDTAIGGVDIHTALIYNNNITYSAGVSLKGISVSGGNWGSYGVDIYDNYIFNISGEGILLSSLYDPESYSITVAGNKIDNTSTAIEVTTCDADIIVHNNWINNTTEAQYIQQVYDNLDLHDENVNNCSYGIHLNLCSGLTISDVTVTNASSYGAFLNDCDNCTLQSVFANGTGTGFKISDGSWITLTLCAAVVEGIQLEMLTSDNVTATAFSGTGIQNEDGIDIEECTNVDIAGAAIYYVYEGVYVIDSTYITVEGSDIWEVSGGGIDIDNVTDFTIDDMAIWNCSDDAIATFASEDIEVSECTIYNIDGDAVCLSGTNDTEIYDCVFTNCTDDTIDFYDYGEGLYVENVTIDCQGGDVAIDIEDVYDAVIYEVDISNADYGIYLYNATMTLIGNTTINNCSEDGIYIDISNITVIYNVNITNTTGHHAIYAVDSTNVYVVFGNFTASAEHHIYLDNVTGGVFANYFWDATYGDAYETGCAADLTFWNDTFGGNYWCNYTGYDDDNDGFGEDPYNIAGTDGLLDEMPIMNVSGTAVSTLIDLLISTVVPVLIALLFLGVIVKMLGKTFKPKKE